MAIVTREGERLRQADVQARIGVAVPDLID